MVSAGNTGATMASALLRMGRIKGVSRPGDRHADPRARLDPHDPARRRRQLRGAGRMVGAVRPDGFGLRDPPIRHRQLRGSDLLSIGEEAYKGDTLRKEAYDLLSGASGINFIGNVEGRDIMTDTSMSWSPTASPATSS